MLHCICNNNEGYLSPTITPTSRLIAVLAHHDVKQCLEFRNESGPIQFFFYFYLVHKVPSYGCSHGGNLH